MEWDAQKDRLNDRGARLEKVGPLFSIKKFQERMKRQKESKKRKDSRNPTELHGRLYYFLLIALYYSSNESVVGEGVGTGDGILF